jgi:hypothetical protein
VRRKDGESPGWPANISMVKTEKGKGYLTCPVMTGLSSVINYLRFILRLIF